MADDNQQSVPPEAFKMTRDPRMESRIELLKAIVFPTNIKRNSFDSNGVEQSLDSPYFLLNTREYGLADLNDFEVGTIWLGYTVVSDALNAGMDDFAEKFSGEIVNYLMLTRSKKGLQLRHILKDVSESRFITEDVKPKGAWANVTGK